MTLFLSTSTSIHGFKLGVWEFPGDVLSSVDWSVTSGENGGTILGSGTASGSSVTDQFISINQYGYNIDLITVTGLSAPVNGGTKYWLNLQNAVVPSGNPVYWDENSGVGCHSNGCPSQASESAVGTIPSEAFTVGGCSGCVCDASGASCTPEPGSMTLLGSGILALVGVLRCKLRF